MFLPVFCRGGDYNKQVALMNDVYHLKQIEISRLILSSVNVVGCPFEVLSIKWA